MVYYSSAFMRENRDIWTHRFEVDEGAVEFMENMR